MFFIDKITPGCRIRLHEDISVRGLVQQVGIIPQLDGAVKLDPNAIVVDVLDTDDRTIISQRVVYPKDIAMVSPPHPKWPELYYPQLNVPESKK